MSRLLVYLVGPMAGMPDHGYPAFIAAQRILEERGHLVMSPHNGGPTETMIAEDTLNEALSDYRDGTTYKKMMKRDLGWVLQADRIYVLPGWEKSRGARAEVFVALTVGTPIYTVKTDTRLRVRVTMGMEIAWEAWDSGEPAVA